MQGQEGRVPISETACYGNDQPQSQIPAHLFRLGETHNPQAERGGGVLPQLRLCLQELLTG